MSGRDRRADRPARNRDRALSIERYYRAMRVAWPLVKRRLGRVAFALAAAAFGPAVAGQSAGEFDLSPDPRPPADSGKPAIVPPAVGALEPSEGDQCPPALPCGTRLLGTVRRNGAVEVSVPALHW